MTEYSYYDPIGAGTVNLVLGRPSGDPLLVGKELQHSILVGCELGQYVMKIHQKGHREWYIDYPGIWARSVATDGTNLFVALGNTVRVLNKDTGYTEGELTFPEAVNFVEADNGQLIIGYSGTGIQRVRVLDIDLVNMTHTEAHVVAVELSESRHTIRDGDHLILANTFGHKVVKYSMTTEELVWSKNCYYPNSVYKEADGVYGMVIEHENKICTYNENTDYWHWVFGAPLATFNTAMPDPDILNTEKTVSIKSGKYHRSMADVRVSGESTLYSPNFTEKAGNLLYICDTDNHRIVVVENGVVVSAIYGFNGPTSLCIV